MLGAYDLVKLEEPPFDEKIWAELKTNDAPTRATAYPVSRVVIGANVDFPTKAPQLAAFFKAYGMSAEMTSKMLAEAREKGITPEQQALAFLKAQPELWKRWLPAEAAQKVAASL